jgi:hypothetical protein
VNFRAKTDGEFLDLHAQLPRDPEMSELVNENGRAKQHQHGGNDVNDIQNGHVKIKPPTKGRPEYIRENFACNHGTQGTAASRFQKLERFNGCFSSPSS